MKRRKPKEESLQIAVSDYLKLAYPKVIFTAEGSGLRLPIGLAIKAARQRSQRGLPDLWIMKPKGKFHGLIIELKREDECPFKMDGTLKKGKHLEEQAKAIKQLKDEGYYALFCVGFDHAKNVIDAYMKQ